MDTREEMEQTDPRKSKRRFLALFLYCFLTFCTHFQFIQYAVIPHAIQQFYGVGQFATSFTSTVWYVVVIPGVFFASSIFKRMGLRKIILTASIFNGLGTAVKCFSTERDEFWLTMIGQILVGCSEIFVLPIPPQLAATWFPESEISKATGIGYAFTLVGTAFGFIVPPYVVPSKASIPAKEDGLELLFAGQAALACLVLVTNLLIFPDKATPKSVALKEQRKRDHIKKYLKTIFGLFKNRNFMIIVLASSIFKGNGDAFSNNVGQMMLRRFPENDKYPGFLGLIFILSGIPGSILAGITLDTIVHWSVRTKLKCLVPLALLTYLICYATIYVSICYKQIVLVFGFAFLYGFCDGAIPIVTYRLGADLASSKSQNATAALQNVITESISLLSSVIVSRTMEYFGLVYSNVFLFTCMAFGFLLTFCFKDEHLRRIGTQNSQKVKMIEPV